MFTRFVLFCFSVCKNGPGSEGIYIINTAI